MRYDKYAKKKKTGALWGYLRPGVWIKLSCGSKHVNTKDVGYFAFNFYPERKPGRWEISQDGLFQCPFIDAEACDNG